MAHTEAHDTERLRELLQARLRPRNNPFPAERPAHLDDVVFLPAALTRLIIDPYREPCSTKTHLGDSLALKQPYLFAGFDDAPREVRTALAMALESSGCAYIGFKPLVEVSPAAGDRTIGGSESTENPDGSGDSYAEQVPWMQLIVPGLHKPRPEADGLVYVAIQPFEPFPAERLHAGQLLGIAATAQTLPAVIPYALDKGFDFVLLDGTTGVGAPWTELGAPPDLTVMRDAIRILRELNREEEIDLIYFGGLRSGTDAAKVLALNCKAGVFGVAMGIAVGGVIADGALSFNGGIAVQDRCLMAKNWIKGTVEETAIIARCTGKTNVHNLEPEDMRSITLATSEAMDIPLASGRGPREYF